MVTKNYSVSVDLGCVCIVQSFFQLTKLLVEEISVDCLIIVLFFVMDDSLNMLPRSFLD